MCDCITKLEEKLVGTEWKKKKILKAKFMSGALMFGAKTVQFQTTSEVQATVEGGKKPLIIPIVHSHCPMCGKPYPK